MKLLIGILFFVRCSIAVGESANAVAHSFRIINSVGTQVTRVEAKRDHILLGDRHIVFPMGDLTLIDDNKGLGPSDESIEGEVFGCTIGSIPLPEGTVQLLFRDRSSLSASEAQQPFATALLVNLSSKTGGLLTCAVVRLFLSHSRRTLVDFGIAAQLIPRPEWQDIAGRVIQGIALDFSAPMASTAHPMDVASAAVRVQLAHALSDCSCLHFVGPQQCTIGASLISDRDIRLNVNGRNVPPGTCISVNSMVPITAILVFDKAGFYNRYHGAVGCKQPGQFVYSY